MRSKEKRRPPEDVTRRYNEAPYSDSNILYQVPLFAMGGSLNWMCLPVLAIDDETFSISTCVDLIVFKDDDLKPDKEGKIIIDLAPLRLGSVCGEAEVPQEFELPHEVLNPRKEKRRLRSLAKDAILIDRDCDPWMYFYAAGDQVRIHHGDKDVTVDIEIVYGKPAVNVEALQLETLYLELPAEVARKFQRVIDSKRLQQVAQKLNLEPAGKSLLNGNEYYKLNGGLPNEFWNKIQYYFEDFGNSGDMQGWLTCEPGKVAMILGIDDPHDYISKK